MTTTTILLDTNAYLRLAKRVRPTLGKEFGTAKKYVLLTLPEVETEVRRQPQLKHKYPWFDDEVFGVLRDHCAGLCLADADDGLDVPFVATTNWGYLRLRRAEYDDAALTAWANRMRAQSWRDCFIFFKHEDEGTGPKFAARLLDVLVANAGPVTLSHAG